MLLYDFRGFLPLRGRGEGEMKGSAPARLAFHPETPVVGLHQGLADIEAQAGAVRLRAGQAEFFKQVIFFLRPQAAAGIGYGDFDFSGPAPSSARAAN